MAGILKLPEASVTNELDILPSVILNLRFGIIASSVSQPLLLASAGYGYSHYKSNHSSSDFEDSNWNFHWHVGAGVSHFINQNAALEGILRHRESFSISFGFQIFLGRAKD